MRVPDRLFVRVVCVMFRLCVCVCVCLSVCLSVWLSVCLCSNVFLCSIMCVSVLHTMYFQQA